MTKEESKPYKRYVTIQEFLDYCKANNVHSSKFDLEAYEKHGLIYPLFRIKYPSDYVQTKYKSPINEIEIKPDWEEFIIFEQHTNIYNSSVIAHILKNSHIFIEESKKGNKYISRPENDKFIPWKDTKVELSSQDNQKIKLDSVKNYYAYWQIFVINELNQKNILEKNLVTGSKRGWRILSDKIIPSTINKFDIYFESIFDYKYFDYLIWNEIAIKSKNITLSESRYNIYLNKIKKPAKSIFTKYSYSYWIQFLRKLGELHYKYLKAEKIKLSNELKRLLTSSLNLILDSTGYDFLKICDDYDGDFKKSRVATMIDNVELHPGYLKRIYLSEMENKIYYSVFISYGSPDQKFAQKLDNKLLKHDIETYFFTESAIPGEKLHREMRKGVNEFDRVVLVCSENSLNRDGVLNEIEETLQRESREGGKSILIPITLDDYVHSEWKPLRPDLAQSVRDRVVADFKNSNRNAKKFLSAFNKLLKSLEK